MKAAALFLASLAAAAPSALEARQQATICDQYGYWSGNGYEANNNMWGKGSATSGSGCTYIDSASSSSVTFRNQWTWQGNPNNVKAYPYVGKIVTRGRKITSIGSMQTSVNWNYQGNNIRANVAYDVFTAADANHDRSSGDYELMIWLARLGDVWPIGNKVGTATVGGKTWDLHVGMNGSMKVFSFVAQQTTNQWSGDVKQFFNYIQQNQGYPADQQHLIVFQFGTEPFTGGPATFTATFSATI